MIVLLCSLNGIKKCQKARSLIDSTQLHCVIASADMDAIFDALESWPQTRKRRISNLKFTVIREGYLSTYLSCAQLRLDYNNRDQNVVHNLATC